MNNGILSQVSNFLPSIPTPYPLFGRQTPIPMPYMANNLDILTIGGLQLWWDATNSSYLGNTTAGAGGVSNNSPVRWLGDRSGNNRHGLCSGADGACPVWIATANATNGRGALALWETSSGVIQSNFRLPLRQQTLFLVFRDSNVTNAYERYWTQQVDFIRDYDDPNIFVPFSRDNLNWRWGNGGPIPISTWFVACCRHNGSILQTSNNNGRIYSAASTLNNTIVTMILGAYQAALNGQMAAAANHRAAEWLMWDRALSDNETTAVFKYLGAKHGVVIE